ncbi:MAG: hypothetical protein M3083_07935 [Actinomycetota bacterium]|nr:hypothetical protein [Actinomycetota bacterium]
MRQVHHLGSEQRHTLERLSRHPLAANIKWPQVLALLEAMGEVTTESKDRYRVTVDGHTEVFRPPHHGDVPADMVMKLRRFLTTSPAATDEVDTGRDLLVVVDHRSATVYEFEPPAAEVATVAPYDPQGRLRHLHHVEGNYQGQRTPEVAAYYRAVAEALRGARTIVIFGHGDGHSDAAQLLRGRLVEQMSAPPSRVIIEVRVDVKSFTEAQLLAAARQVVDDAERGNGSEAR